MHQDRVPAFWRAILWQMVIVAPLLLMSACSDLPADRPLEKLRIGVLPDESAEALRQRYRLLFEYLEHEAGLTSELVLPADYNDLLTKFGKGEVDIAYFGGMTFVKARAAHGAVPLVMRDVDSRFTSVLLVPGAGPFEKLDDLKDTRFSFGSRLSTSGHLMPRHFLETEYGIVPEEYFSDVRYSGKHDLTAYRVRDQKVDAGIANSEIVRKMQADGRHPAG